MAEEVAEEDAHVAAARAVLNALAHHHVKVCSRIAAGKKLPHVVVVVVSHPDVLLQRTVRVEDFPKLPSPSAWASSNICNCAADSYM